MDSPIPPDALMRIEPVLRTLQDQLQPLLKNLPDPPDSAIQFRIPEEA